MQAGLEPGSLTGIQLLHPDLLLPTGAGPTLQPAAAVGAGSGSGGRGGGGVGGDAAATASYCQEGDPDHRLQQLLTEGLRVRSCWLALIGAGTHWGCGAVW